jgi:hypothetical protein
MSQLFHWDIHHFNKRNEAWFYKVVGSRYEYAENLTGKAEGQDLARLEDRPALDQGRKQIYSTQIRRDNDTQKF